MIKVAQGILCVIGGVLIQITYGNFYTVGNMAPYILDYLRARNHTVEPNAALWLTSIALSFEAIAMPIGGIISTLIGFRLVVLLSCLMHSISVACTYFTLNWGFIAVVASYGVLQGFGFGFGYSVIIATSAMWFPKNRGLIVGLTVGGFGAGAMIFTPIQTAYINPKNMEVDNATKTFTDPELLGRIPSAFLLLAGVMACIQVIGVILMREAPKADEIPKGSVATSSELAELKSPASTTDEIIVQPEPKICMPNGYHESSDIPPKIAIRSVDFYLLWFSICFAVVPVTTVPSLYKILGLDYIGDDLFLAGVTMASSVCNAGGRVIWGLICDRFSFKVPMCVMLIIWTVLLCTFPHLSIFTGTSIRIIYTIWVCGLFFCLSGVFIFGPTATEVLFGQLHMAVNYGLIYNAFIVGSLIASAVNNIPALAANSVATFGIAASMSIIALLITIWISDRNIPTQISFLNYPVTLRTKCMHRRKFGSKH